eukprot:5918409-Prymnesium_polylepis.1
MSKQALPMPSFAARRALAPLGLGSLLIRRVASKRPTPSGSWGDGLLMSDEAAMMMLIVGRDHLNAARIATK